MLKKGTKLLLSAVVDMVDTNDPFLPYRIRFANGDTSWVREDTCKPLKSAVAAKNSLNKGSTQRPKRRSARA